MDTDVQPLPTVEEIAAWMKVGSDAVALAERLIEPAYALRQAVAGVYTSVPLGLYLEKDGSAFTIDPYVGTAQDLSLVLHAASRVMPVRACDRIDLADWVKVAWSPTLRAAGELGGFFPGPHALGDPSPVRSMLTSGLLGAGLGYGAGMLGEQLMPHTWQKGRLRKTLGMLGGAIGAAPGAIWGASNKANGRDFNDPAVLNHQAGETPTLSEHIMLPRRSGDASEVPEVLGNKYAAACAALDVKLGDRYLAACRGLAEKQAADMADAIKEAMGDSFWDPNDNEQRQSGPMDVNVDAIGNTLWQSGASPQTAGMTMAALQAAQQMPGGNGDAGWVTPTQMANLAAHMGAGYLSGAIVGKTLGLLTGLTASAQETLSRTGMYVAVVQSVVPKLFGM